ncbi:NUDIX hydrolase [Mobilicoccus pelagius]|uniref:NTP pyrophosphohydrolase MutT n=1 Tax=Mobilicoccus pelagius NBRC 104925 TaxID=1089455 RepID=H5UN41_9MICO|nr:NUDIX hydrolase [Mobilicoccus pelagius]GAB47149.1 NTP pyrophosphohydrolase MutT [Mobilicoccus pelagius NBRC 104925]
MGESRVRAAGTLPWRRRGERLEVLLVHRPHHRDWSWPKGKLDPGEEWPTTAVRETLEEAGLRVRLGRPLPVSVYPLPGSRSRKEVRYWAAEVVSGDGVLENEIDETRWVTPAVARRLATYPRDLEQLRALTGAPLATRTVGIVRHAHAVARKKYTGDEDRLRPLDKRGEKRASALAPLLSAYGFSHIVSSPSVRCADTVKPYLATVGDTVEVSWRPELSEEGFEADPDALPGVVTDALDGDDPVLLGSHGPVLRPLLAEITRRYRAPGREIKRVLEALDRDNLDKGELVVLHVGTGHRPAVLAVERHRP